MKIKNKDFTIGTTFLLIFSSTFLFGQIEDPTYSRTVNEYFFSFVPLIIGEIFLQLIKITLKPNALNSLKL